MRSLLAFGITPYGLKERTPNIVISFLKELIEFARDRSVIPRGSSLYALYERGYATFMARLESLKPMLGDVGFDEFINDIIKAYKIYEPNIFEPQKVTVFVDTVHAAKGLEAQDVIIYNHAISKDTKVPREVRYVAATRTKNDLYVVPARGGWFT
jgi:superfamily I DNA/RNA helicase